MPPAHPWWGTGSVQLQEPLEGASARRRALLPERDPLALLGGRCRPWAQAVLWLRPGSLGNDPAFW